MFFTVWLVQMNQWYLNMGVMFIKGKPIGFGYKIRFICSNDGFPYHIKSIKGRRIIVKACLSVLGSSTI